MIAWADMTKFGRMDTKQLNFATSVVGAVLGKHPTTSIGIILAPHLVSEKVSGGHRGEMRFLDPHPLAPFIFFAKHEFRHLFCVSAEHASLCSG